MTSPTSSPQKPTTGGSPAARSTSGGGGGGGAGAATPGGGGTAAGTGTGTVAVGKWQWSESTIPNSGAAGWTRLWRLARLLLQANC